jgi:hypothetical protein
MAYVCLLLSPVNTCKSFCFIENVSEKDHPSVMAAELIASAEEGRRCLRMPKFALGGATPLELLKTAEASRGCWRNGKLQADRGPV